MSKKLVIERICECSGYIVNSINSKEKTNWTDIVTGNSYSLHNLIEEEGWEIEDVKVSTSKAVSEHGFAYNLDHTILILVKNDRGNNNK